MVQLDVGAAGNYTVQRDARSASKQLRERLLFTFGNTINSTPLQ
jgi:hypothetical protein